MSATDFAIDVRGVTKKFGARTVVNDIAMQVRPGKIYGFLGPNGSGKTTFLRMLCGERTPPTRAAVDALVNRTGRATARVSSTARRGRTLARARALPIFTRYGGYNRRERAQPGPALIFLFANPKRTCRLPA